MIALWVAGDWHAVNLYTQTCSTFIQKI